jgi:hypothetical protein
VNQEGNQRRLIGVAPSEVIAAGHAVEFIGKEGLLNSLGADVVAAMSAMGFGT